MACGVDARLRAAVREGIAQADRGEFIEEEEMDARLEQVAQICSSRSAALLTDRAQGLRSYKTGPRYARSSFIYLASVTDSRHLHQ